MVEIEEVVEIEVEHKIVEEVLGQFGGFWSTLRRFLQAGSTFCGLLAKSLSSDFYCRFWAPFLTLFRTFLSARFACFTGLFGPRGWFLARF